MSQELATVLFTDVEGSTALRTQRGDSVAHLRLQALHQVVTQEVEHHQGRVIKALGDGVLAVFRTPRTAVTCSIALQREVDALNRAHPDSVLRVRVGINTGEVLEENDDVFGEAVNAAARIAALAGGGQTLVSGVVRDLVGTMGDVSFEDKGPHSLKGFKDEWFLHEVLSEETPQLIFLDKTPFVGREPELAQLDRVVEQVLRGRGAVVMIGGEPGVGKTRLAEQVSLRAQQKGMLSFIGHCYEREASVPYAPFVEILEATAETVPADAFREVMGDSAPELARFAPQIKNLFPDIPPPADLPGEESRRYTFNSISRYMRRSAAARPLMLILDDLHWGDESTILLLEHLALNLHDVPVLIVGTYRDVELAVSRPLSRTLETLVRQRSAQRLSLKRLSEADVLAMLHRLSGSEPPRSLVNVIYSETEGNAFFVEEVFRHLLEEGKLLDPAGNWRTGLEVDELDVPEGVRLVIGRRLERLQEATKKVLTAAAVVGRVFEFGLFDAIADLGNLDPLDALDEAERAHLISPIKGRDARYSFVHELVRQTLLTDISLPRRQRLHLQIAEAIENKHSKDLERWTADLAHHFYQAGAAADLSKTIAYLIAAGDKALRTAASEEALRAYEDALTLVEDDMQRGQLLQRIGRARRGLRQWSEARVAWEEALNIFERRGARDHLARTCQLMSERHMYLGEWEKAIATLDRALAMPGEHTAQTGGALALQAVAYAWYGKYEEARERLDESIRIAEVVGHPRLSVGVLVARTVFSFCFGRVSEGIDVGYQAAQILRAAGSAWGLATVLSYVDFCLGVGGRWDDTEDIYAELWPLAGQTGNTAAQLFSHRWHEGLRWVRDGNIEDWARAAEQDIERALESELPWAADSYSWLGWCKVVAGDLEDGSAYLEKGVEGANEGCWQGWHLGFLMMHLSYVGQRERVLSYVPTVREAVKNGSQHTAGDIGLVGMAADALATLGEWDLVRELHETISNYFEEGLRITVGMMIPFQALLAVTCRATGAAVDAERHFQEAHRFAAEPGGAYQSAEINRLYGLALIDLGDAEERQRGRELLDAAGQGYETLGLHHWASVLRALRPTIEEGCSTHVPAVDPHEGSAVAFKREGEFWTLGRPDSPIRLKDSVGLGYLAQLLKHPGQEIHALDVVGLAEGTSADSTRQGLKGDTGETLDPQAKEAYRLRLVALQSDLEEAESWADDERAVRVRAEIDALTDELAKAVGLGGKDRMTGSVAERARVNVTKALKSAIAKIAKDDPLLGDHLMDTVRTGTQCAYLPGPDPAFRWVF